MAATTRLKAANAAKPQRKCTGKGGKKAEVRGGCEPGKAVRTSGGKRKGKEKEFIVHDDDMANDSASYAPSEDEDVELINSRSKTRGRRRRKRAQPAEEEDATDDEEHAIEDEEHAAEDGEDVADDNEGASDKEDPLDDGEGAADDQDAADDGDPFAVTNLLRLAESNPFDVLHRLIIQEKVDVIILDENDTFSMTLAFAAMRRSFDGIWCSRVDESPFQPFDLPRLLEENHVKARSKHLDCKLCARGAIAGGWTASLRASLNKFTHSDLARLDLNFWAHQLKKGCDALPLKVPTQYIWLNPPPAKLRGKESAYLQSFLYDCSQVQKEGGVVFVTLSGGELVGDPINDLTWLSGGLGYEHFKEDTFVRDNCQHNGYHPKGDGERAWITHIFIKSPTRSLRSQQLCKLVTDILPSTAPRPKSTLVMEADPFDTNRAASFVPATPAKVEKSLPPPEPSQATTALLSPPPSPDTPPRSAEKRPAYTSPFADKEAMDVDQNQEVPIEGAEEPQPQPQQEKALNSGVSLLQPSPLPRPRPPSPSAASSIQKRKSPRNHSDATNPAYLTKPSFWKDQCTARHASKEAGPSRTTRGATKSATAPVPSSLRKRKQAERSPSPELLPPPAGRRGSKTSQVEEDQHEEDVEEMQDQQPQREESVERIPSPSLSQEQRGRRRSANSRSHASSPRISRGTGSKTDPIPVDLDSDKGEEDDEEGGGESQQPERSPSAELSPPPARRHGYETPAVEEDSREDHTQDQHPQQEELAERSPSPSPSRELRPLKRLRRGPRSANSTDDSSSVTLVPSPSPAPLPLRRSTRRIPPKIIGRRDPTPIESDSDEEEGDEEGGDEGWEEDEDDEMEVEERREENRYLDLEARDAGMVSPNIGRYGVRLGNRHGAM